jgi:cell division protease FtsH
MNPDNHPNRKERRLTVLSWIVVVLAIVGIVALWFYSFPQNGPAAPQDQTRDSLAQIVTAITADDVKTLTVRGDILTAIKKDRSKISARKESNISAVETLQILGAPAEALAKLPIVIEEPATKLSPLGGILSILVIVGVLAYFFFRSSSLSKDNSNTTYNFGMGRSNPRVISAETNEKSGKTKVVRPPVTFRDVAGAEQAKLELQEFIEFLKEPAKFARLGARIPKGVLMAGPPGTGKTLMAKAVAGEARVPFFSISGSEFVEMFVGVGAARVRDLFKRAREQAPAIIFVDEIDAVGRQRGANVGNGSDEREQTLNQILVEMDGFATDTTIIVMASTNRPDILDPALLRPGRFDRKVILDRPDVQEREAILRVHTRGKPLAPELSLSDLAKLTPGFVGADLENLVNEAAILAARRNLDSIGRLEFQDAMERIIAGPERQSKLLSGHERKVVAYHEAGHAVVMHHLENCDPVHKVSIISRGMALGYTMPLPEGDRYLRSREAFEDEIVGLLGGRVAEEIAFQQITTGAANDLERATKLARAMVTRFGFSQKLGVRTFGEEHGNPYLGNLGEIRNYSEEMAQMIDQEVYQILDTAYQRAKGIIVAQRGKLEALADALLEYETVERPHFEALMA